jgi:hypothetical protein
MERDYHCCATCRHFQVVKQSGQKAQYMCRRLGYETQPAYRFTCWAPTELIIERMQKKR